MILHASVVCRRFEAGKLPPASRAHKLALPEGIQHQLEQAKKKLRDFIVPWGAANQARNTRWSRTCWIINTTLVGRRVDRSLILLTWIGRFLTSKSRQERRLKPPPEVGRLLKDGMKFSDAGATAMAKTITEWLSEALAAAHSNKEAKSKARLVLGVFGFTANLSYSSTTSAGIRTYIFTFCMYDHIPLDVYRTGGRFLACQRPYGYVGYHLAASLTYPIK